MVKSINNTQGLSLIELLISLLLSSLLAMAAIDILSNHNKLHRHLLSMSEMQENGRFGLYFLAAELQMAGHSYHQPLAAIDWQRTKDSGIGALKKDNDFLAIKRIAAEKDYNCLGVAVVPKTQVSSFYYVKGNRLICRADYFAYGSKSKIAVKKGTAQTLIEDVESFQVLYGVGVQKGLPGTESYVSGNQWVERYLTADQVDPKIHQVLSVRIGLSVKGEYAAEDQAVETEFLNLLDRRYMLPKDGHQRRSYESTVVLRNVPRSIGV